MADVLAELQALDDHLRLSGGSVAALLAHHAVQAHGLPQWTAAPPVALRDREREPINTPMPAGQHAPFGGVTHQTPTTHSAPDPAHDTKAHDKAHDTKDAKK